MQNIVREREYKEGRRWTEELRKKQASVLGEALAIEEKAIAEIEKTVETL